MKRWTVPLLALAAVLVGAGFFWLTRDGMGFYSDTDLYITMARNFFRGFGFMTPAAEGGLLPETFYPPGYPALLSWSLWFKMDPLEGSRWLHAALFAGNTFLAGFLVYRLTEKNVWAALSAGLLTIAGIDFLMIHTMIWSEPPFLFLIGLGLFLLSLHLDRPRPAILIASALVISLVPLTRYAGLAWPPACLLAILVVEKDSLTHRLRDALLFGLITLSPIGLWCYRNHRLAGDMTSRIYDFHPGALWDRKREALATIMRWLTQKTFPWNSPVDLTLLTALIAVLLWLGLSRRTKGTTMPPLLRQFLWLTGLVLLSYGSLLTITITSLDASTPLDERLLSPAHFMILIGGLAWIFSKARGLAGRQRQFLALFCVGYVSLIAYRGWAWSVRERNDEIGYGTQTWRSSALIALSRQVSVSTVIYTNVPYAILVYADRGAELLPHKINLNNSRTNPELATDLALMCKRLGAGKAIILYFNDSEDDEAVLSLEEIQQAIPIRPILKASDGTAYADSRYRRVFTQLRSAPLTYSK